MKLPEHLQHFPHPTLVIACDTVEGKFFLVGGDSLEELDRVAVPRERKSDHEGGFSSDGGMRMTDPSSDKSDAPRLHDFIHQLVAQTDGLVKAHGIAHIHLVMPAEVEHSFTGHLPQDDKKRIGQTLHLDVMKEDPLKIMERLLND